MEYGCDNLWKRYGQRTVLAGLGFQMSTGERLCIVAPSGGGKTTLLRLLAGLEHPDMGQITGFPRGEMAMAFQQPRMCERRSALTNVAMVHHRPDRAALMRALEEILPPQSLCQPVEELSGGMRRRVEVARAVLSGRELVLLDEPFTGLDQQSRERTARFILSRMEGRTLIYTAHEPEHAAWLEAAAIVSLPPV